MEATVTVSNLDVGPCQVNWNAVDLGATLGNCTIKFKYEKALMAADQFGPKTILDKAISGMDCTIETEIAETRNKVGVQSIFPNSAIGGTTPHQYVDFKNQVSARQLALAQPLALHPLVESVSAYDYDWYFYKALPSEDSQYVFSPTKQASLKIIWEVYLDTSVSPARLFRYGDHSL